MVIRKNDPQVAIASNYLAQARTTRRPQHPFNLKTLPYQIQPFMLAPVLPGETLQSLMLQSQTWSQPLNPAMRNIGWWQHWNYFYVKHRDLPANIREALTQMVLDPDFDMTPFLTTAIDRQHYTFNGALPWTKWCLDHIVSEYFRDEGEDAMDYSAFGLPLAQVYGRGTSDPFEKLTLAAEYEDRRVDLDVDQDGKITVDEVNRAYAHWAAMQDAGLMEMDYQDWIKTYGSKVREDEESPNLHRAEDIWSMREFTYPTNTVEPSTGKPSTAVGWRVQKSGGKRLFCDEPGFIFGVTYTRPKIYLGKQTGSVAGAMQSVHQWLPAILNDQFDVSHLEIPNGEGPIPDVASGDGYWLDLRDLLLYGDQFVNFDPANVQPFLQLPRADASRRYALESELSKFFAEETAANFETDGLCSLAILGRQQQRSKNLVLGRA